MARTALAATAIARTGIDVATLTAAEADGNYIANNNGNMFLFVKNGSGVSVTVTVQTPQTVNGLAVADLTVVVAASEEKLIGPFPNASFNQTGANRGQVWVDYSAVTSVTVGAYTLN